MSLSFLKYQTGSQSDSRGDLAFGRAHVDGMPFRGPSLPLREEEYHDYTEQVNDFKLGLFDISDIAQMGELQEILDRACNGWYVIADFDKRWIRKAGSEDQWTILVFLMYIIPHRELAKNRVLGSLMPTAVPMPPSAMPS